MSVRHAHPANWGARPAGSLGPRPLAAWTTAFAFTLLLAAGVARADGPAPRAGERPGGPDSAPVRREDGETMLGANDLARLLDATKFWRSDVRKLELRVRSHRVLLTADNPYVMVDQSTIKLRTPVRSRGGELQAPIALLDSLPADSSINRLIYDPRAGVVLVVPPGGVVRTPRASVEGGVTRVVFPMDQPEDAEVVGRARAHFRLRFPGYFTGIMSDSLRAGVLRGLRRLPVVSGCAFEVALSTETQGFRVVRDAAARRVTLELSRSAGATWEPFAPEGPPGPRALRVVVLDPGHGGADAGVTVGDAVEKQLALNLARRLKTEIEHELHARVVLTRDQDRALGVRERAEVANRAHADVVLSLHFDGLALSRASGASAYCPPADARANAQRLGGVGPNAVALLPWGDVAARHAVESRSLAEALLSSLDLHGLGPTRLREHLAYPQRGVNAPTVLLECAMLTSNADRARVSTPGGLDDLAQAIVEGLQAYQRNE